jgi:murein DD-endopeptidase MepM/ murein hydrolase activator NlpD
MTPIHICVAIAVMLSLPASNVPRSLGLPVPGRIPEYGTYSWPLRGPVIRGFQPPPDPYQAGHRGIDIASPYGTSVGASREGVVAFAGRIGGSLFVSIDHLDGVRTTYSWLSEVLVKKGDAVERGQPIGRSGQGHLDLPQAHLHFGARVGPQYIDPMLLLEGADVSGLIHLAPLGESMMGSRGSRGDGLPFHFGIPIRGPPGMAPT